MLTLETGKSKIALIGDPHLGKKFLTGVPLSRRGEREANQLGQFEAEVTFTGYPTIVVMGDLFDKFVIDYDTLYKTYLALVKASETGAEIFILQGNHDVSRDTNEIPSLDLLEVMTTHLDNINIVREPQYYTTNDGLELLMFIPYSEFLSTRDIVASELSLGLKPVVAFGHWEVESFGGNDNNLMPIDVLAKSCKYIVTGHIHTPSSYFVDCDGNQVSEDKSVAKVIITGSMQPYSHAEDPYQDIYCTIGLDQYNELMLQNPAMFRHKCLRLLLSEGQEVPANVDALQFTYKYVDETSKEVLEAKMEVFSFKEVFSSCMKDNGVSDTDTESLWDKYQEIANDAAST